MKAPILSRLLVGSALALMVALGALAMRVALPDHDTAVVPEPAAAPPSSVWKPDLAPDADPAPAVAAPSKTETARAPATRPTAPANPAATHSAATLAGKDHGSCAGDDAGACPSSERESSSGTSSRPSIARDSEFAASPRGASSRGGHAGDRHVSSGPMRMLGGAETTW